ncbi:MAG: glycoside hydrolase family 3 N-terminal domain-containing protein [Myxococcota bacterium]
MGFRAMAAVAAMVLGAGFPGCDDSAGSPTDDGGADVAGDTIVGDAAGDADAGPTIGDWPQPTFCEVDEAAVDSLWEGMTLRERVGQHVMLGIERSGQAVSAEARTMLEDYAVGGIFLAPPATIKLEDPVTTAEVVADAQAAAQATTGVPLWVALDQEGGPNAAVNSLTGGTDTIGSMPIGATMDPQVAFEQFDIMGREVRALGFNMDLGPVLDTLTSTHHGNLNTRAFGPRPHLNAALGVAAVAGLQQNLVMATGKHFPGDGLTAGNTHRVHVTVDATREEMEETLLMPFQAAVDHGVGAVMTIPAQYTAFDDERSAITSRAVTTDLLRGDMGFEGLVVTDSLGMEGVNIGLEDGDVKGLEALKAGADVLLDVTMPPGEADALYAAVEDALADGSLDTAEFEASTKRILREKQRWCLFEGAPVAPGEVEDHLARPEDAALSRAHGEQAAVLLADDGGALPLGGKQVLYVGPDTLFQDAGSGWLNTVDQTFADAMRAHDPSVADVTWQLAPNPGQLYEDALDALADTGADVLVVGTLQGRFSLEQQQVVEWLLESVDVPVVHVILGVPFDWFQTRGRVSAGLALMGSRSAMVEAGAAVLYGEAEPGGTMLYDLSEGSVGEVGGRPGEGDDVDRCETESVACAGGGACVDTGDHYGCVCQPNWHPAPDGLDCVPDGE